MVDAIQFEQLENKLDCFNDDIRKRAFVDLLGMADSGEITVPEPTDSVNLHAHSFFSYNGYGFSPTHLVWLAKKLGIGWMGIVDFDVLDGVDEFLDACALANIRGTAGMETRVYIPQMAEREINSPGEPGVAYHMGSGFTSSRIPDRVIPVFESLRQQSAQRNRRILERVNRFLDPLAIDYETDVLPLTPAGYATERHLVTTIFQKSLDVFSDPTAFWYQKLQRPEEEVARKMQDPVDFKHLLRQRLMKRGGVGYIQPGEDAFPRMDEVNRAVVESGAIPCAAWLDGMSEGESDSERWLALMIESGVRTINIIPDRNWDIADPSEKQRKLDALYDIAAKADDYALPVLIGTEMNSDGQKWVDDLDIPELRALKGIFIAGAAFLYGHSRMEQLWGMGYQSDWAARWLPDRKAKKAFYEKAGRLISPQTHRPDHVTLFQSTTSADEVIEALINLKE